jgi:NADPH:quinone reductase-like Zn-dependent oxidoreductase
MDKMKAVICNKYGTPEVLQVSEVIKPTPKDNEVLIKVYAAGVTASDIFMRSQNIPLSMKIPMRIMVGITKPRKPILGMALAGKIESVGKNIKRFKPGDSVYGMANMKLGAYAEYVCMKETYTMSGGCISLKPDNISYEEATVAVYGGLLAFLCLFKNINIQKGDKILIYGASGTSGTMAIQIAKHLGAEVTAVCSASNIEMVKNLGADHVIDYTQQDTLPEEKKYDFVMDAVGKQKTSKLKGACKNALVSKGKFLSVDNGMPMANSEYFCKMKEYIDAGYIKPVLDRCYPMDEIVEAHRYVEKGHKKGGVAITIDKE